jgi:hypothetical protein
MTMDSTELVASDPRVRAILTDPDAYFSAAMRRAWPEAAADIQAALDQRARARHDGARDLRLLQVFLRPLQLWRSLR